MKLRTAVLFFVLVAATGLANAAEVVRFTIESIAIEGTVHASPRIIVAESRLREGQTYTESELRDAVSRIDRLPFVINSEFRLARGTAPGLYVLIVTIHETKPLFVSILSRSYWTRVTRITGPFRPPEPPPTETVLRDFHNNQSTVGGRWFAGAKGMAYVAADTAVNEVYVNDDRRFPTTWRYNAGYTQYDLFGTSASLTALVSYQNRKIRGLPGFDNDLKWRARYDLSYQIVAVVPIAANQSITGSWGWHIDPSTIAGPQGQLTPLHTRPIHLNSQQLAWRYDTTDDPLFPTTGTLLRAAGIRDQFAYVDDSSVRHKKYNHHEQAGLERFWSLTPPQSISAGIDYEQFGAEEYRPHIGWSTSLWGRERTLRLGDLRAEAEIDRFIVDPFSSHRSSSSNLHIGFAFRNTWGVVRANFQYSGWSSR